MENEKLIKIIESIQEVNKIVLNKLDEDLAEMKKIRKEWKKKKSLS